MKLTDEEIIKALQDGKGVRSKKLFATTWTLKKDGENSFKIERFSDGIITVRYVLDIHDLGTDDWEVVE